ncbi:MAG: hypothetical protein HW413_1890, partial [Thermoleophilia bacterium]|nr:hypothetical protein [Thermoleophilia bacterium]
MTTSTDEVAPEAEAATGSPFRRAL